MGKVFTSVCRDEIEPMPVIDVRSIPLDRLQADDEVRKMVTELIESVEGQSRVPVTKFNSAI